MTTSTILRSNVSLCFSFAPSSAFQRRRRSENEFAGVQISCLGVSRRRAYQSYNVTSSHASLQQFRNHISMCIFDDGHVGKYNDAFADQFVEDRYYLVD